MESKNKHIDIALLTRSLAGETSPEEQKELKAWLADSEVNRQEYGQLRKTWELLDRTSTDQSIDIDAEWKHHLGIRSSGNKRGKQIALRSFIRIAAAILILVGLGIPGLKYFSGKSIKTNLAETQTVMLPDGSKLTLNAGSNLSYGKKFGKDNRLVNLKGEAYFEVVHDPENPFIIKLNEAEIKVLGTEFNVKAYSTMENIEVTVSEGRVSIYDRKKANERVIAIGGEKAEYNRSAKTVSKTQNTNRNYMAWKTRLLVFEDVKLSEVTQIISQVYHKDIRIRSQELDNCRLTTRFDGKDLETVLKILESTFDVTLSEEMGIIYLSGTGCE